MTRGWGKKARIGLWLGVVAAVGLLSALSVFFAKPREMWTQARIGGQTYHLEVVSTVSQQVKGLGERASMPADRGMLFTYHKSGRYCYWMKGMQFPLDIIWLDAGKRVLQIERDLSPASYPASYCPAGSDTRYVIELNAGQAQAARIEVGGQLHF